MRLALLQRRHSDFDPETLQTYQDLFVGGSRFKRNIQRYLPQNDMEPAALWKKRCDRAHYLSYCAPVAGYFASLLFTCPPELACDAAAVPDDYAAFKEDCDGKGTDLVDFLRARFLEALVSRRAFWRVEFPATTADGRAPEALASRAEYERARMGVPRLVPIPAARVVNWRCGDDGAYAWVLEHDRREELAELEDPAPRVTETWTQWRADGGARRWEITYAKGERLDPERVVPEVDAPPDRTGRLPVVALCLPKHLWLLDQMASGQLENFRARNALAWAIYRTCYAMPVFKLANAKRPPAMGAGYYLTLGKEDALEWPAPPSGPFEVVAAYAATLKDELYRVASQMAAGVENNAAAVGRSGDSKQADNAATEAVLPAFGAPVRAACEQTLDLMAAGRGEAIVWSVGGMDRYSIVDSASLAEEAVAAGVLEIPSLTHKRELLTRVALAQLPDADEATKHAIRAEIAAGLAAPTAAPAPPEGEPDDEGDEPGTDDEPPAGPPPRRGLRAA